MFDLFTHLAVGALIGVGLLLAVLVWSERPWR